MKHAGILSLIGNTPLVRLDRLYPESEINLYAKLEGVSVGGSVKDRAARSIIGRAWARGEIGPGSTVIESSSGNMGIGLAQACLYYGLPFICVVDPKATAVNVAIIRTYGAEVVEVIVPDPATGEFLPARVHKVQELMREIPGAFWSNQYSNPDNALAHHQTFLEIFEELDGRLDLLFLSASTCGQVRGCSDYIAEHGLATEIWAVDAVGSVIFGGESGKRLVPGHGAALQSGLYRDGMVSRVVYVSDADCVRGCRLLVQREAILAGGSSGALVSGIGKVLDELPPGLTCAVILPDRGERYLDTIYCDAWVKEHLGCVDHEVVAPVRQRAEEVLVHV